VKQSNCELISQGSANFVLCVDNSTNLFEYLVGAASALASLAIIAAAWFAYCQIKTLKSQIAETDSQHISTLLHDTDLAMKHISSSEQSNRLEVTLKLLIRHQSNQQWVKNRTKFIQLRDAAEGLQKHANQTTEDTTIIRKHLNHYELIAIGIKQGILDEEMFRNYYKTTVVRDYTASLTFIEQERTGPDARPGAAYWSEFESMAKRFEAYSAEESNPTA